MSGYYYPGSRQQPATPRYSQGYPQQLSYQQIYAPPMQPSMSSNSYSSQSSSSSGYAYTPTDTSPPSSQGSPTASSTERPWFCPHPNCLKLGALNKFTRKADLERHIRSYHAPQRYDCPVAECDRKGTKGLPRSDKLRDHLREVHGWVVPKTQERGGVR